MRVLVIVASLAISTLAFGHDYYRGYAFGRYGYPYGDPYIYSPRTERELARIREELRTQRLQAGARGRERDAEINTLRGQANASHQISAAQACYYRTVGGLELCDDLFEADSDDYSRCETLVEERNPGCALTP